MAPTDQQIAAAIEAWKRTAPTRPCRRWHAEHFALYFLAVAAWAFFLGLIVGGHHG